jgi:prepilin-type processing-associated H-X9-DG protein
VPTLTQTPPARIQVANVAYCDAHSGRPWSRFR